jgi:hypothetical protein
MIGLRIEAARAEWAERVRDCLRARGYYYEPDFCCETGDAQPVVSAARILGRLYVLPDTDPAQPVILTRPSPTAPQWRPFDRRGAIGWHNDFSTRPKRPVLSLSWVRREDPTAPSGGAWRVASATAVLNKLCRTREGEHLVAELAARAEPFGYRDAGGWRPFRVVTKTDRGAGRYRLRFYGRALEEGAWLRFGHLPDRTCEIIARVEEAADAVGEVLRASTGALLIADNRYSLHDRVEQEVTGPEEHHRQAWLCFVQQLHQPL